MTETAFSYKQHLGLWNQKPDTPYDFGISEKNKGR